MKITHCIYNLDCGGGAENMLIDILNSMCQKHQVQLIIVNDIYDQEMIDRIDSKVKVVKLNRKPGSRSILPMIKLNFELIRFGSEIVHCHNYTLPIYILPSRRRKMFYTIHDLNIPMKYSRRMTRMFAISDAVKDDAQPRAQSEIVTIPNGIHIQDITQKTNYTFAPRSPFNVVNVARLEIDKKGQDILIKAVAILREEGVVVNVDLIGDGSSREELNKMIAAYGLEDQIKILGLKSRDFIYSHLHEYDAMCHPARYEGFGLTIAEAMAANLPVIVSDEGGPYELIDRGNLGLAFKMEDENDCATKLKEMINNYQKYVSLTPKGRQKVVDVYSVDAMVDKYLRNYSLL